MDAPRPPSPAPRGLDRRPGGGDERPGRAHGGRVLATLALVGGLLGVALAVGACKGKPGALSPPPGAPAWSADQAPHFDDGITLLPVALVGRSPSDIVDQRLFDYRLGFADLVVEVTVVDHWERSRAGKAERFVEVELGEFLLGERPKRSADRQRLRVESEDPLPGDLRGRTFLLFLRWAPGERPPLHHHLMVADEVVVSRVVATVEHARASGHLDEGRAKRRKARRGGADGKGKGAR